MNKYYVDYRFKEGVKFLKLGYPGEMLTDYERRLYPLSVTVFIDPRAHILYWKPPDKSDFARMEWEGVPRYLYLQDIVDVRIGDEADKSQINEFSHSMNANLMTIVTAENYVNVHFTSFIYNDIGENSTSLETLVKLIFDLSQRVRRAHHGLLYHVWKKFTPLLYASSNDMFNEFHIRQVLDPTKHSQTDEISMEEGIRQITNGLPLKREDFTDKLLVRLILSVCWKNLEHLTELFQKLSTPRKDEPPAKQIPRIKFLEFLQKTQRDPRLNEEVYPPISINEMNRKLKNIGYGITDPINYETMVHFLWTDEGSDLHSRQFSLKSEDMNESMSHYLIDSSHNTYCVGLQLSSARLISPDGGEARADTEMYRQVLLAGCRCIELDCWNGPNGEPIITHGPSAIMRMNELPLREVCEAIAQCAFKTTPYPLILSIENHLSMAQQNKMVEIFKEYFKEMLLCQPLENHPLDGRPLPSPEQLKYKILVKAKRCKVPKISRDHSYDTVATGSLSFSSDENYSTVNSKKTLISLGSTDSGESLPAELPKELISLTEQELRCVFIPEKEEISYTQLSSLVNYMEADRPANFSLAERRPHILCSVDEDVSWRYFKEKRASHLLKITTRRIVRVYPKNFRICSDNYFPMNHWVMGVQMVALNYQTPGIEMLLNQAMFERNDSCGYVLKPECMRNPWELIDIHSSTPQVPNRSSVVLKIKILSGHFYSHIVKPSALQRYSCPLLARQQSADPITTYVTVQVFDLPEYEKSKCYRTKEATEEATVTKYNHKSSSKIFLFEKIVLSELAYVHFCVWQRVGCHSVPVAHKLIPVEKLNNGYRNITLRNVNNQCIGPASLFVLFDVHYFSTQRAISRALALPFDDEKRERDFVTAVINPFMSEPEERPIMKLEELDGHTDIESSNISNLSPTISNLYQRKLSNPQVTPTKSGGNLLKKISGFLKA